MSASEIVSIATLTSDPPSIEFRRAMHRRRWLRGFRQPGVNGHPQHSSGVVARVRAPLDALIKEGRLPALDGSTPAEFPPPPEFFRPWLATENDREESLDGQSEESSTPEGAANTGTRNSRFASHRARIDAARAEAQARKECLREQEDAEERFRYQGAVNTGTPEDLRDSNLAALLTETLADAVEHIRGLLPEGLGFLAGPPKVGKSLAVYQMTVELALRGIFLDIPIQTATPVLYYALEDGKRRSQKRFRTALKGRTSGVENVDIRWTAPRLGAGLEEEINEWLDAHLGGVVVIDVLAKVQPNGGRRNTNAYNEDYSSLTHIHNVTKAHPGSTILFVTHDRKAGAEDWMARVTGTRGITGAADFVIFLHRARTETFGTFYVTGRDIPDAAIDVNFADGHWERASLRDRVGQASTTRQIIYDWLDANGPAQPKAIADGTNLNRTTVRNQIARMVKDGQLRPAAEGYTVGGEDKK